MGRGAQIVEGLGTGVGRGRTDLTRRKEFEI